jgi:hypothetical protein
MNKKNQKAMKKKKDKNQKSKINTKINNEIVFTSGASSPEWVQPTPEGGAFFCVTCVVLSSFVYWLAFCVLTCLLFYLFEFVYLAISAE